MPSFIPGPIDELGSTVKGVILNRIIEKLIELDLEGVKGRWYFMRQPWISEINQYPCGVVSEFRGVMSDTEGVIGQADSHFRYIVALARAVNYDHQNDAELMLEWDQQIRRAFRKQAPNWLKDIAGAKMIQMTVVEAEGFLDEAFRKQADAMYFLVDVHVRELLA